MLLCCQNHTPLVYSIEYLSVNLIPTCKYIFVIFGTLVIKVRFLTDTEIFDEMYKRAMVIAA